MLAKNIIRAPVSRLSCLQQQVRSFVKVGDKVPVAFVKDEAAPVIKADSDYPDWLFSVGKKMPSKAELLAKFHAAGADSMTKQEQQRLKRLIGLDEIRSANAQKVASA